jgi:ATP-binding cassette subfamily B protein IrtB
MQARTKFGKPRPLRGWTKSLRVFPKAWQTTVGEDGRLLSGGERQRVSIARAILKDSPIILLDELSSSLDPVNEAAVHDSLRELTRNRTTVIVTHQMHTILRTDNIIFVDRGRIVESGTHDELVARNGRYSEFLHAVEHPHNRARKETPE